MRMSWFSFHGGHSGEFCRHAQGTLEEVVQAAIAAGLTTYGVTEHAPRYRAVDLYPDEQELTPADLLRSHRAYNVRARALQARYADQIEILVGFETEIVPPGGYADHMLELREAGGFDYIVGSVHHVGGRPIDVSERDTAAVVEALGGRDACDRAYFDAVTDMIKALGPEVVGHLDLIRRFRGHDVRIDDDTWPHIERTLSAAIECDAVLDVNAAPARKGFGPVYPSVEILTLARLMGLAVTLGDDSHGPDTVGVGLQHSVDAIRSAGYEEVACLHLRGGRIEQEFVALDALKPAENK